MSRDYPINGSVKICGGGATLRRVRGTATLLTR